MWKLSLISVAPSLSHLNFYNLQVLVCIEHSICAVPLLVILPRPSVSTGTLRLGLEVVLRFPAWVVLASNLRIEACVLAVIGVKPAFGDVLAVRLAAIAGVGDDGGDVAGRGVNFGRTTGE